MPKRSLLTLIIFCFITLSVAAQPGQNPQPVFDRANRQLQQGHTRRALATYKQLEAQQHAAGALFLNMGLSYIRLDSMGRAKYYFLKAQQFEDTAERAGQGLTYVENHFSRQSAELPALPWQRATQWLAQNIGAAVLLALGLLLLNLGVFLYLVFWFKNRLSSSLRGITAAAVGAGLVLILLSFFINYRQQRYHRAVMVHQQTAVRTQPAADAELVSQAFEGYTFRVDLKKSGAKAGWAYVRMSNGQFGWIPAAEIMIL